MKFLLFILFFITIFFFNYSVEITTNDYQDITNNDQNLTITSEEVNTTTSWWTRTYPIIVTRTARSRPIPQLKTSTLPNRVSKIISISVPAVLFAATILFGFGLIAFAIITHGNGVSFLTRTNEHRLV